MRPPHHCTGKVIFSLKTRMILNNFKSKLYMDGNYQIHVKVRSEIHQGSSSQLHAKGWKENCNVFCGNRTPASPVTKRVKYGEMEFKNITFTPCFTMNTKFTKNNRKVQCEIATKIGFTTKQRMFRAPIFRMSDSVVCYNNFQIAILMPESQVFKLPF